MLSKSFGFLMIGTSLLLNAQNSGGFRGSCESAESSCAERSSKTMERPSGPIDGKNGRFTLSRTPADGSHLAIFNTGLELEEYRDYALIDGQIILRSSSIPQPGEVLTVVYSATSPWQHKALADSKQPAFTTSAKGGDITDVIIREAINGEFKEMTEQRPPSSSGALARSIEMIEVRPVGSTYLNSGFDGLGDERSDANSSRDVNRLWAAPARQASASRALDMLNARNDSEESRKPTKLRTK